jgi:hypothetical protein
MLVKKKLKRQLVEVSQKKATSSPVETVSANEEE